MEINMDNEEEDRLCNEAMDLYEEEERLLDAACNEALDLLENNTSDNEAEEAEQSGGQFKFEMFPHTDKRARKFGVHRRVFTSRLTQPRNFSDIPRADLPRLIERALQQAIAIQVLNGHENDQDFLMINMSSNRLRHSYQSHRIRVGEWKNNEEPARQLLDMLSRILNSNEQFQVDDSFHIEVTHVQNPERGSGRKRYRLGTTHIDELLKRKKSVVLINNDKDELCCARALVTAQAYHEYGIQHNLYWTSNEDVMNKKKERKLCMRKHVSLKHPVVSGNWNCFKSSLTIIKLWWSRWIMATKSFSKAPNGTNNWS